MAMGVTDTVMLGWLGATELAASVLATQAYFLLFIFGACFAHAAMPLAANAEGRGDARGVRRSIRMGLWVLGLYSALAMVPLWHIERILLALGQEPELAALAGDYMRVALWALPPATLVMGLRSYLSVVNRAWVILAVTLAAALLNGLLNWVFIFGNLGAPALGIVGAALATTGSSVLMALLLIGYTALAPALRRYELWVRFWRPDWKAFFEVVRLGWPIGATIIAEVGLFSASSVMMGWLGTIPLAAHGIALQLASIAFGAARPRERRDRARRQAYGRGSRPDVGRAGDTALAMAAAFALSAATIFLMWPERSWRSISTPGTRTRRRSWLRCAAPSRRGGVPGRRLPPGRRQRHPARFQGQARADADRGLQLLDRRAARRLAAGVPRRARRTGRLVGPRVRPVGRRDPADGAGLPTRAPRPARRVGGRDGGLSVRRRLRATVPRPVPEASQPRAAIRSQDEGRGEPGREAAEIRDPVRPSADGQAHDQLQDQQHADQAERHDPPAPLALHPERPGVGADRSVDRQIDP